jgi:lysyl-tRNA synthetase class 2
VIQKAGVVMVADLKELNPNKFHQDICGINKKNKLGLTNPSKEEVAAWIEQVSR